ncbi:hypothetical protein ACHHYP_07287 [Achlya hypogyna]|uniref:Protein ENHANCED DISEASE RESISTANCE 2 C-terminal domain-containing protein n=1 Tax=Achlya hypogyna TaxID=1202772 RepID=A0A1V9YRF7_ACHHY|nr:hypothetical protein ACHHYP_07287 [Achlya hypogyna]
MPVCEALGILVDGVFLSAETLFAVLYLLCQLQPAVHHYTPAMAAKTDEALPPTPVALGSPLPRLRVRKPDEEKHPSRTNIFSWGLDVRALWSEPNATTTLVRGLTYAHDGHKVPAGESLGRLLHVDMWQATEATPGRQDHVAELELSRPGSLLASFAKEHPDDTLFLVNIQLPGTPFVHMVCYWRLPVDTLTSDSKFSSLFERFRSGDAAFQNARFKLVPTIVDGPWLVKTAVPQKPAITGNKITQRYYTGRNYVEVDMDIQSSTIANNIVGLCRGYAERLVVDLSLTLQGNNEEELPERIFGSVRFAHLDFTKAEPIPCRVSP